LGLTPDKSIQEVKKKWKANFDEQLPCEESFSKQFVFKEYRVEQNRNTVY